MWNCRARVARYLLRSWWVGLVFLTGVLAGCTPDGNVERTKTLARKGDRIVVTQSTGQISEIHLFVQQSMPLSAGGPQGGVATRYAVPQKDRDTAEIVKNGEQCTDTGRELSPF